ncbi:hypothetical protein Hanom_Chr12g01078341 [Helianthus anomalus]
MSVHLIRDVLGISMGLGPIEVTDVPRPDMRYTLVAKWGMHVKFTAELPRVGKIIEFIVASKYSRRMYLC